jgi:hypothetical protein
VLEGGIEMVAPFERYSITKPGKMDKQAVLIFSGIE